MADDIVEVLYDAAHTRRVVIFRRTIGTYGYREEKYYKNDVARTEGWTTLWVGKSSYDTPETARREVVENVSWLPRSVETK